MNSKPLECASWAYHDLEGFYIAPSPYHYRCLTCYLPATRSEVVSDIMNCIPRYIPISETSLSDHIRQTDNALIHLLLHKSQRIPTLELESSRQDIIKLAEILHRDTQPVLNQLPTTSSPPPSISLIPCLPIFNSSQPSLVKNLG